jgi:hypothetical protein
MAARKADTGDGRSAAQWGGAGGTTVGSTGPPTSMLSLAMLAESFDCHGDGQEKKDEPEPSP